MSPSRPPYKKKLPHKKGTKYINLHNCHCVWKSGHLPHIDTSLCTAGSCHRCVYPLTCRTPFSEKLICGFSIEQKCLHNSTIRLIGSAQNVVPRWKGRGMSRSQGCIYKSAQRQSIMVMRLPPSDSLVFVQDQELYNDRALYINDADWEMCSICFRVPTDYLVLGDQFIHTKWILNNILCIFCG